MAAIPYYIKEQIARDFHTTAMTNEEIGEKYGATPKYVEKIAGAFPHTDIPGRADRVLLIITKKLMEIKDQNDMETLAKVAEVLSRV